MPSPNPRGRPRAFDVDEALDAAVRVFASKGYEGASLTDLTHAMGINRVSLYATFGNKEALFAKCMARYTASVEEHLQECLSAETARAGLMKILRDGIANCTDKNGMGVCYITQPPITDASASKKTKRDTAEQRARAEVLLQKRFERAVAEGELPADTSVADLARYWGTMMQGLALQAQHGATANELVRVVDVAMASWPSKQLVQSRAESLDLATA